MKRKRTPSTQMIDSERKKRKLNGRGKAVEDDRTTTPDEEKEKEEDTGFTNELQNETKQESKNESDEQKKPTSPDTSNASDEEDVRLNDASTISRPEASKFSKLYRLLADNESIRNGLEAKDPDSDRGVAVHVATGSNGDGSKYISTCQSLPDATKLRRLKSRSRFADGTKEIAEIDVNKLPSDVEIIDLTSEELRRRHEHNCCDETRRKFHKYAEEFSEVLIVGKVPPECLQLVD